MKLGGLLKRKEPIIGIDVGTSGLKLVELQNTGARPKLLNLAMAPLPGDVFSNNVITKTEGVAERISALLEANDISDRRAVVAMPGASVFIKKIKMAKMSPAELSANIQLEVGNFIPHKMDDVKVDYHIVGEVGKNQLEILVVAVKDEVINSFVEALSQAGVEPAVVDVDYFALQNCFELGYPDLVEQIVALIDVGARYASINICKGGQSLFTGEIAVGGRAFSEALAEGLGMPLEQADALKKQLLLEGEAAGGDKARAVLARRVEQVASEFNRQLSLFWNASGVEDAIGRIMVTGGGGLVPGFLEALKAKTGIECEWLDALRGVDCGSEFDAAYLKEVGALMAVPIGLALRQPGDKEIPDYKW